MLMALRDYTVFVLHILLRTPITGLRMSFIITELCSLRRKAFGLFLNWFICITMQTVRELFKDASIIMNTNY